MANTVDLRVVGVKEGIQREEMLKALVDAFKQDESAFTDLLDAAYGITPLYVAQSNVDVLTAEEGRKQLESVGLICSVISDVVGGLGTASGAMTDAANDSVDSVVDSASSTEPELPDLDTSVESLTSDENPSENGVAGAALGAIAGAAGLATAKGSDALDKLSDLAGSDESLDLEANTDDSSVSATTEMSAEKSELDIDSLGDLEFSDDLGIKDSAAIGATAGLSAGKKETNFDAASDFDDDLDGAGTGVDISLNRAKAKPEIGKVIDGLDFTDENVGEGFANAESSDADDKSADDAVGSSADATADTEEFSLDSESEADKPVEVKAKTDVPEAFADLDFGDLEADLIDPAPAEKSPKKEPVELDDGGLSLSSDESEPLTAPKAKSDPQAADDGGLSLDTGEAVAQDDKPSVALDAEKNEAAPLDTTAVTDEAPVPEQPEAAKNELSLNDESQDDVVHTEAKAPATPIEDEAPDQSPELAAGNDDLQIAMPVSEEPDTKADSSSESDSNAAGVVAAAAAGIAAAAITKDDSDQGLKNQDADAEDSNDVDPLGALLSDLSSKANVVENVAPELSDAPLPSVSNDAGDAAVDSSIGSAADIDESAGLEGVDDFKELTMPSAVKDEPASKEKGASGGLVLGAQIPAAAPTVTPEADLKKVKDAAATIEEIDGVDPVLPAAETTTGKAKKGVKKSAAKSKPVARKRMDSKKLLAAVAGTALLVGGGTFAFQNKDALLPASSDEPIAVANIKPVNILNGGSPQLTMKTGDISNSTDLEELSTEELLVNLSVSSNANSIVELEPYFLDTVSPTRSGPRFGAAVPAESERMVGIKSRVPHPADKYFDDWSNREADLSLFLALLDSLIEKDDLSVAQQLSDRAKDKLFAVMSGQRLARAYSEIGKNQEVSSIMALASRDTYAIKSAEERVLAISDYALTEQALGLNEDSMDTFLKTSILARNLVKPEHRTVALSSAARYFQLSGREAEAQQLLDESLQASRSLPQNTAARDLATRYIALSEARMGLFNQALEHTKLIVDPFAAVSAYHGIALAIEHAGDETNARKVLNMAYRAGSEIEDKEERDILLSKVVLASETE